MFCIFLCSNSTTFYIFLWKSDALLVDSIITEMIEISEVTRDIAI